MSLKVTIFIPAYNRPESIQKAIESSLSQDYDNLEVLVGDDSTNNEVEKIIKKYFSNSKFKYYKNEKNLGMASNWRKGLKEYISGDYFIILGDDDYFINDYYISQAVNLIENNHNITAVYSNTYLEYKNKDNKRKAFSYPFKEINNGKDIFMYHKIINVGNILNTLLLNKNLAITYGFFDCEFNIGLDVIAFYYSCLLGNIAVVKDYSGVHTFHEDNLSLKSNKLNNNYIKNSVNTVIKPFNFALKNHLLSNVEKEQWENTILFDFFFRLLIHANYYDKSNFEEYIELLQVNNHVVLDNVLNSFKYKLIIVLEKLNLFKFAYDMIYKIHYTFI